MAIGLSQNSRLTKVMDKAEKRFLLTHRYQVLFNAIKHSHTVITLPRRVDLYRQNSRFHAYIILF